MHIAIIPDGNRRWATERGLDSWQGHREGAERIRELLDFGLGVDIQYVSIWGSSRTNLRTRPKKEVEELLRVYEEQFSKIVNDPKIHERRVRINILGDWRAQFPVKLKRILSEAIDKTREYDSKFLTFFLAYDGDKDVIKAVQDIVKAGIPAEAIDETIFKCHLSTFDLPPVDLAIRTGGEAHFSTGFLMWEMRNAQLNFTNTFFPDYRVPEFQAAIKQFETTDRRQGK